MATSGWITHSQRLQTSDELPVCLLRATVSKATTVLRASLASRALITQFPVCGRCSPGHTHEANCCQAERAACQSSQSTAEGALTVKGRV
ncbi:hypothetical protein NQZ68_030768 [Dissostichus eleginoides]|nr:hypothetical protein NQZ68_030768 [Dissostichus eleginoides]